MNLTTRQRNIIDIIKQLENASISLINSKIEGEVSIATLNRDLAYLVQINAISKIGKGRATSYKLSDYCQIFLPLFDDSYFDIGPDERDSLGSFNFYILDKFFDFELFTSEELQLLEQIKATYNDNISKLNDSIYQKEIERLTIELSWKSSEIEGNTYSLLETEQLFLEKKEAVGKQKSDAIMLLNHKDALDYLLNNPDLGSNLNIRLIEELHSILIKDLDVGKNIRSRTVGITGSVYKPLDNSLQIREALERLCNLINSKDNCFEKSLLAVLFISYIQPFEDGNKRTARMISNALLIAGNACPLSYRSVSSMDYKKAMLLFYEQNNIAMFKDIFIEQNIFTSQNYF